MAESLVALVGNPNCGKTALFNTLTGLRNKVANYPGVTVEVVKSELSKTYGGNCVLIDLPGTYSLSPVSDDEAITSDLLSGASGQLKPQLIINVLDATQLELGLGLTLDLLRLGSPVVVVLNMMDLAESSGAVINVDTLARELGVPVVAISATKKWGLDKLSNAIKSSISTPQTSKELDWNDLNSKGELVHKIVLSCTETKGRHSELTARVDKYVLHPVYGPLILLAALALIFQAVFAWAAFPMDLIEGFVSKISELISTLMPEGLLRDLLVDGIIGGVGSVIVFLPQIVILFSFILFLEDFGYMARASYLMDRIMGTVGLSGKAVIPLVSGLACAVPSILATRSIPSKRDRLLTMMLALNDMFGATSCLCAFNCSFYSREAVPWNESARCSDATALRGRSFGSAGGRICSKGNRIARRGATFIDRTSSL
ncbi:MAG: ferrous iron transporter B [Pseudomonadota bacterium]